MIRLLMRVLLFVLIILPAFSGCGESSVGQDYCMIFCDLQKQCADPPGSYDGAYEGCQNACEIDGLTGSTSVANRNHLSCANRVDCVEFKACMDEVLL